MLQGEVFILWDKLFKTPSLPWFLWRLLLVHLSLFLSLEASFSCSLAPLLVSTLKTEKVLSKIFVIHLYLTTLTLKRQLQNTQRARPKKWPSNNFAFRASSSSILHLSNIGIIVRAVTFSYFLSVWPPHPCFITFSYYLLWAHQVESEDKLLNHNWGHVTFGRIYL